MDDEIAEVSGYWANLNHPSVAVEDTRRRDPAVPQRRAGLDRRQPVAKAGHLHQGAHSWIKWRVRRRRDRPRRDLHRRRVDDRRAAAERPVDDPRRGRPAGAVSGRGSGPVSGDRRRELIIMRFRSRISCGRSSRIVRRSSPAKTAAASWRFSRRFISRTVREGHLSWGAGSDTRDRSSDDRVDAIPPAACRARCGHPFLPGDLIALL